jgi:PhnB protein
VSIHLYVEDVDAFFKKALAAGAKERKPVTDQFYGDRTGQLEDPFGHLWRVATHKEDVAPEEIQKRAEAMFAAKK